MITPAQRAEIRRLYYSEHWKLGTIAAQLGLHRETVRAAVEHASGSVRGGVSSSDRRKRNSRRRNYSAVGFDLSPLSKLTLRVWHRAPNRTQPAGRGRAANRAPPRCILASLTSHVRVKLAPLAKALAATLGPLALFAPQMQVDAVDRADAALAALDTRIQTPIDEQAARRGKARRSTTRGRRWHVFNWAWAAASL